MKVYFARHGETDWNAQRLVQGASETDLNAVGIEQAHRLGEKLAQCEGIVRVYTSEMRRANLTGRIVAERLGVPCETRPGLQEVGFGVWEGKSWRQIQLDWPEVYDAWGSNKRYGRAPGGENYEEVLTRVVDAVLKIIADAEGDVVIVSHSGCLLSFQAELNNTPLETMHRDYSVPNAGAFVIDSQRILDRWAKK